MKTFYKGSALIEFDYSISSQFAAIRALRLTEDAEISRYTISTFGARDSFGGPAIASLPYFNTPFFNLPLIETGKGFTNVEIEELITAGATTLANNRANSLIIAGFVVTTYKTDIASNIDVSFKYLNYVDTSSNVREYFFNNFKS